ncbi:hypothetical protein P7F88_16205 [Vibrio hannami]|uniref:hypothetical protein n=1 Tax=Vibrio hannami TaxID=2717094 RepID=UPI00240FC598|nr:hypothetical protein [Vibrio hannami]MDG3087520.1 hypothetical protein [Vibrio hannami]
MLAFYRKKRCMAGVSVTLEMLGMDKRAAMDTVSSYPEFFSIIDELSKKLPSKPRDIIASLVLVERMLLEDNGSRTKLTKYRDFLYEGFKHQLKNHSNWREIAHYYCVAMNLVVGVYMPSKEEIEDLFDPEALVTIDYSEELSSR